MSFLTWVILEGKLTGSLKNGSDYCIKMKENSKEIFGSCLETDLRN